MLIAIFIFILILTFFFGDSGIIEIIKTQRKIVDLRETVKNLELEKERLIKEIRELKNNPLALEKKAREILSRKGYNEFFVHSLGHGVGLEVHELPTLALVSEDVLIENHVFTIEPGVYITDFGGVRIEDVVHLTKKGAETLTKADYSLEI